MTSTAIRLKRTNTVLQPDQTRVLLRPFIPGDSQRSGRVIERIMALPEHQVDTLLNEISAEFADRHPQIQQMFLERFEQVREHHVSDEGLSDSRRLLIGAYFLAEYSLESAALFNPSIVPHTDQTNLPHGALRFILSLRATGEGHISSITFRTGIVYQDNRIEVLDPAHLLTEPRQVPNSAYEKSLFSRKLNELGLASSFTNRVLRRLHDSFSTSELRRSIDEEVELERQSDGVLQRDHGTAHGIWMLARSNYEVQFQPQQKLSERILFPATPTQLNGIEDARFVRFRNDDGSHVYYATFTAYDGRVIMPELVETDDFLKFRFITLNGPAAKNKGMAMFPRKINGHYAMLSRQDNESISLMFSDNIHFWNQRQVLLKPKFPWELVQLGNCGSPIETDAGWLVLSHGVGALRKYCIGAFLLDRDDPGMVLGRLRGPLLSPNENERAGYVPNVVYTCGAHLHGSELIIPYAMADHATGFATVPVADVLAAMEPENA
ncbi:MAG: glycoside hydrolase family 130 protein [Planctomycetaceae bacterium]